MGRKGKLEGEIALLVKILQKKFGSLPESLLQEINSIKHTGLIETVIDGIFDHSGAYSHSWFVKRQY